MEKLGATSRISAASLKGLGQPLPSARSTVRHSPIGTSSSLAASVLSTDMVGVGFSRADMLAMNAGIDEATRSSNALSTASDAIGVVGGLLGNIQEVLTAAGPNIQGTFDSGIEQSRIDSAISTIDAIASSSRFAGRTLLTGSFGVSGSAEEISIPSFVSSSLGSPGQLGNSSALSSLFTGHANDLSSGNLEAGGQIVTTALSQVAQTQTKINGFLTVGRANSPAAASGEATSSAAIDLQGNATTASAALANSSAQRVLALLGP